MPLDTHSLSPLFFSNTLMPAWTTAPTWARPHFAGRATWITLWEFRTTSLSLYSLRYYNVLFLNQKSYAFNNLKSFSFVGPCPTRQWHPHSPYTPTTIFTFKLLCKFYLVFYSDSIIRLIVAARVFEAQNLGLQYCFRS